MNTIGESTTETENEAVAYETDFSGYTDDEIRGMDAPPALAPVEESDSTDSDTESDADYDEDQGASDEDDNTTEEETEEFDNSSEADTTEVEENEGSDELEESDEAPLEGADAELAKLFAPFTANGKQVAVKNVDEAIKLMQQGAGFHKNMAKAKPYVKAGKTLEKHSMLDEETINFMVDLKKGNPAAIKKLARDHNVTLGDDFEEGTDQPYVPEKHSVTDKRMALDEVLADIETTSTYAQTVKLVGETWDEKSSNQVADKPELLKHLNNHMANGLYEQISEEVERKIMLGEISPNMSNLDAYLAVGDHLFKAGLLGSGESQPKETAKEQHQNLLKEQADKRNKKRNAAIQQPKRKAAKPVSRKQKLADLDPWSLSQEEFEKASKELGIHLS